MPIIQGIQFKILAVQKITLKMHKNIENNYRYKIHYRRIKIQTDFRGIC